MPKILRVRAPQDEKEERWVRKLAASRHGPADWIVHARIVVRSWDGERVETIAKELGCSALTLRRRLHRFDAEGIEGLGDRPKPEGSAQWSLDALAQAAKEAGIVVKRSQIRRILLKEKVRWRRTHSWGTPRDKDARPKRTAVVTHSTDPPKGSTTICTDELGPVVPRTFPPAPGWSPGGHRIKAELDYSRRSSKPRVSPRRNSTDAPKRGSGADLPRIIAAIVVCFVTVFKE